GLSATFFQKQLTTEIMKSNSQTAALLVYNLDSYILELERLTLAPYTNIELLRAIKEVEKNLRSGESAQNQLVYNRLDYIVPKSFMYVGNQVKGVSFSIGGEIFIVCEKYDQVKIYEDRSPAHQDWYNETIRNVDRNTYYGMHQAAYYSDGDENVFSVVKVLKDYNTNRILGVIKADGNGEYIQHMMGDIGFSDGTIIILTDATGAVTYATVLGEEVQRVDCGQITYEDYVVSTNELRRTQWEVQILSPKKEIEEKIDTLFKMTFHIMIGCVALALVVYGLIVRCIVDPFNKLLRGIKGIEKGNFDTPIQVKTNLIELKVLQDALNHMQRKVKQHIDQEYKEALARKNAEYEALQARINPHFLYNTLSVFITLNRLGEKEILQEGILALTGMMRYIFEKQSQTTLGREIAFIRQYLELSRLRFEERLDYELILDESVSDQTIPKLLFQPIVENSIVHGLEESGEVCQVKVHVHLLEVPFKDGQHYVGIVISDTGAGFDVKQDYMKPGEGLHNIKQRLEIIYPESIFHVESVIGVGTTTTIIIPYEEGRRC
ncbi:MAG: cache domain-containing sensor histidine kinase, partial [Cellulosilyticaceae bacterium]